MSPASLAWRLTAAADQVAGVLAGRSLADSLPDAARQGQWPADARGAVTDLTYSTLRRLGHARAVVQGCLSRPLRDERLHALLCVGTLAALEARYPAHTLVDQAVEAARADRHWRPAAGLVNAVLRRVLREPADPVTDEARHNLPAWWLRRLRTDWPTHWAEIVAAGDAPPAMTLRVNRRRCAPHDYGRLLRDVGIGAQAVGPAGWCLDQAVPVERLPGWADGWVSVQDLSAQQAAVLLDAQQGDRVLDACAAPGGKTAHVLEQADCELLALDMDARRLQRVADTLQRLGLSARLQAADASRLDDWWDGRPFDRVLLDAPCSGSGVVRRHADMRWLRRDRDIAALAQTQRLLLDSLWKVLKPGGTLLYATCSVFHDEGLVPIGLFLKQHPDAQSLPVAGSTGIPGFVLPRQRSGDDADQDGFFYALIRKRP